MTITDRPSLGSVARSLAAMRRARPLVHNITNFVAMDISANVLLAAGASPAMVHSTDEVETFVPLVDALVINVGTLQSSSLAAMRLAALAAGRAGKPWVLDPVGMGITPFRNRGIVDLLALKPAILRGNAGEILAIAGSTGVVRGVDSAATTEDATAAAHRLAASEGIVVAVTGEYDIVTDGRRAVTIEGGHPLMPLVTGMGCALSALSAAFAAVTSPLEAAAAACAMFAAAGALAGETAAGPASLRTAFIDALYRLSAEDLTTRVRISALEPATAA